MPEKPNYLNGMIIKEKVFPNGGKQLKIWVKVDEFVNELKSIENKWSANIFISRRKEVSEKGVSHNVYEDTYKPEEKKEYKFNNLEKEDKIDLGNGELF